MTTVTLGDTDVQLLAERAIYVNCLKALMVSDVHLGKPETFQHYGMPIPSLVNEGTLNQLEALCLSHQPDYLWVLGDLFHSAVGLTDNVIRSWLNFLARTQVTVHLIVGNHDRPMVDLLHQLSIQCFADAVEIGSLVISHEPYSGLGPSQLNICGHVHPCIYLRGGGDQLRLPCFYWEPRKNRLTLPAFGEFTWGHTVTLHDQAVAYSIADHQVIPFSQARRNKSR